MSTSRVARIVLVLSPAFAALAAAGWYVYQQFESPPPAASNKGRLVVIAVFDQMRGDYLERWSSMYSTGGFEKMKKGGVWFSDAHLPYAVTSTGPGHASISTGVPPSVHGIVENDWYDRLKKRKVYCASADRPYERIPANPKGSSRSKDGGGLSPERLLARTAADQLREQSQGKAKIFSLAVKDRAAVLMGGKEPTGCYCLDTATGEFHTSTYYRDRVHGWVEQFNKSAKIDRWFGKDWDRLLAADLYDRFAGPDDQPGESQGVNGQGRAFPHPLNRNLSEPGGRYYAALECSPFGNELLWDLGKTCIDEEKLGKGESVDLLYLGFSCNDMIGHNWGPDSHEVMDVTLRSDVLVAEMIQYLTEKVGPGRFTLIITADHGVCPLPEMSRPKHPEAARFSVADEIGTLTTVVDDTFGRRTASTGSWIEATEFPWVYLNRQQAEAGGVPIDDVADFGAQWIGNRDFCQTAYSRRALLGPPLNDPVGRACQLSFHPERSGDILPVPRAYMIPGYSNPANLATGTTHGTPQSYDTHIPVIAFGANIPELKQRPDRINALVVTTIIHHALGISPANPGSEPLPPGFDPGPGS